MQRAAHPIYGYFVPSDEYYEAIINWHRDSFGVADISRDNIGYENGVLGGVTSALHVLCTPGEPILVHSPTYTGFTTQLERNGFPAVLSPLVADEKGVMRMDYEDMERKIRDNNIHTALFCSPHNPSGRVWEREELENCSTPFFVHESVSQSNPDTNSFYAEVFSFDFIFDHKVRQEWLFHHSRGLMLCAFGRCNGNKMDQMEF